MTTKNQVFSLFLVLFFMSNGSTFAQEVCSNARYLDMCTLTMSAYGNPTNPVTVTNVALVSAMEESTKVLELSQYLSPKVNTHLQVAVEDCAQLMGLTRDHLQKSLSLINEPSETETVRTLLSAVITNYDTCMDSIKEKASQKDLSAARALRNAMVRGTQISSNALAIFAHYHPLEESIEGGSPFSIVESGGEEFPAWLTSQDRRVLLDGAANADIVVAKDGSGSFKTIGEALAAVPDNSKRRYVILVKAGVYQENSLQVTNKKINVMLLGEGMDKTIITGSKNVVDGTTTFNSASLAAVGQGFMARDMAFINTAGPVKQQAVALRVGADQSVFYKCRIEAYQDTLYVHSLRQFFRECTISGTVDFIFGNAAVVFQKCNIVPRKPGQGQKNAVTAQGRTDPNQNTGISIQSCVISGEAALVQQKDLFPTYLGRPWKQYSRTVVMQSYIGVEFQPAGWLAWDGDFALNSLFYAEYINNGPGSGTSKRVTWKGYRVLHSQTEAVGFTVKQFIQGNLWLPNTGVVFTDGF